MTESSDRPHVEGMSEGKAVMDLSAEQHTEYRENFIRYPLNIVRGKPHEQQLSIGGEFSCATENRDKFVAHTISKYSRPPKEPWVGNDLPFDGTTTQRTDFPEWKVVLPPPQQKQKWISSSGKFDSLTTNKADFKDFGAQARYRRPQQQYTPNNTKFEGLSSHMNDFKAWPILSRPSRRDQGAYARQDDDRDFRSTTAATYVYHEPSASNDVHGRPVASAIPEGKFEGLTTSQDAFQKWPVQARQRREKAAWIPSKSKMQGATTYTDNFKPKTVERVLRKPPNYPAVVLQKFDAVSTNKSDFLPVPRVATEDFRPRLEYQPIKDDRDFLTTNKTTYDRILGNKMEKADAEVGMV
ncbi:hypothetical protein HDU76_011993 [Blyttiomyces sp. JEL0837]|nr:hypothetical protein HDU76_011993 [Blyttiomyces sp. JEL0837]